MLLAAAYMYDLTANEPVTSACLLAAYATAGKPMPADIEACAQVCSTALGLLVLIGRPI